MVTRKKFDYEINHLKKDIGEMAEAVNETVHTMEALIKHPDVSQSKELVEHDKYINELQKNIETRCLSLLLKQQPVARDLRLVSTGLKVVTDLERIGDQCADIAEITVLTKMDDLYTKLPHIASMLEHIVEMMEQLTAAVKNEDVELARETRQKDQKINALFDKCKKDVVILIKQDEENIDYYLDFLMISKYLEKIGDHIKNVCEWIEFNETGMIDNFKLV
ncbi:MAG: phosphate signaling complex protein PhoU [Beduini sp.]|uniref:phosphate signaling complex protein PhoU n=1 Tax=Beduini sp. TaxID=1922300 RepID=UPI0039A15739